MSTCKANNFQIGQSVTATNNFTWYQPASPDGTVRLGNGNSGSVTDLVTLNASGQMLNGLTAVPSGFTSAYGKYWAKQSTTNLYGYVSAASAADAVTYFGHNGTVGGIGTTYGSSGAYTPLAFYTSDVERMRLDSSGNLGLGVTPSAWNSGVKAIQILNTSLWSSGADLNTSANAYYGSAGWTYTTSAAASAYQQSAGAHYWLRAASGTAGNAISFTQAMTLDASGNLLVGHTATDPSAGGARFQLTQGNANWIHFVKNSNTSGNVFGSDIVFSYAPNNTSSAFFACGDSSAERLRIYANGGIANYSANNVNLSDERVKTDITPAPSWLAKINAIEVVNFKYKDQTHEDPNLGVIAQQVLSVAPELVDEDGFGETPEDGIPLMAIFETDLKYAMLKAIQELSAELNELKKKVNA